jgi:hypothetical protein
MSNSCKQVKQDLVDCIHKSLCFQNGKKFVYCLKSNDLNEVEDRCFQLRRAYFLCKRGQVMQIISLSLFLFFLFLFLFCYFRSTVFAI